MVQIASNQTRPNTARDSLTMAPIATDTAQNQQVADPIAALKAQLRSSKSDITLPPDNTLRRYQKAGIDLSGGYPYFPPKPDYVQDVAKIRTDLRKYVDPASRADPEKKALFSAAKKVVDLTTHIGVSDPCHRVSLYSYARPRSSVSSSRT